MGATSMQSTDIMPTCSHARQYLKLKPAFLLTWNPVKSRTTIPFFWLSMNWKHQTIILHCSTWYEVLNFPVPAGERITCFSGLPRLTIKVSISIFQQLSSRPFSWARSRFLYIFLPHARVCIRSTVTIFFLEKWPSQYLGVFIDHPIYHHSFCNPGQTEDRIQSSWVT